MSLAFDDHDSLAAYLLAASPSEPEAQDLPALATAEPTPSYTAAYRKLADALAHPTQRIIIQAKPVDETKCYFYAYESAEALDLDTSRLLACHYVRERVDPRWERNAFVDVDSKRYKPAVLCLAWAQAWPGTEPPAVLTTTKGYHLIGKRPVTIKEHRRGLAEMAGLLAGGAVDTGAIRSLRVAGSKDKVGSGRKGLPTGMVLSETLVQPLGMSEDGEADTRRHYQALEGMASEAEITAGVAALTDSADAFEVDPGQSTADRVHLRRLEASMCRICKREHTSANAYLILNAGSAVGRAYCYQVKKAVCFKRPGVVADVNVYPGPFTPRTGATYEKTGGVANAPEGDYLEGSPCGLGKSKAAWASIDADMSASVLLVSYRKTFSSSQGGLHGCEMYSDTTSPIVMTKGRRVVCQYESLRRVQGMPEVLVIDELHGIRRQACGEIAQAESWVSLVALIKGAGRLVVLDAYANDDDRALIADIRGRPVDLVRNTFQPHTGKAINVYPTIGCYQERFLGFVAIYARMPREQRLQNRFVVVCQWRSDVEAVANTLEMAGLRGKAYHGKTCAKTRAHEFANHGEAWKDAEFVVYNSTLEAGVSVEGPEWTRAWVLMRGMGHVEAAIQSLHRFRCVKEYYAFAARHQGGGDYPTSEAGLVAAIMEGERFAASDGPELNGDTKADARGEVNASTYVAKMVRLGDDYTRSAYARMWMANQLEGNRSARHWPARFYDLLAETGFAVRPIGTMTAKPPLVVALPESEKKTLDLAAEVVVTFTDSPAERVAKADARVWQDVLQEHNGETPARDLSAAEIHSRDKVVLMAEYGLPEADVTEEVVSTFGSTRAMRAHRNIRLLTRSGTTSHASAVGQLRLCDLWATKQRKGLAPLIASHSERASRTLAALTALGFAGLEDTREVPRRAIEASIETSSATLAEFYKARGRLWPDIRRAKPPTTLKAHLGAINSIMETQYGAKVVAVNTRRDRFRIESMAWPVDPISAWRPRVEDVLSHKAPGAPVAPISGEALDALLSELSPLIT